MDTKNALVCSILKKHQEYITVTSVSRDFTFKEITFESKKNVMYVLIFLDFTVYIYQLVSSCKCIFFAISAYGVTLPNKQKNFVQGI